MNLNEFYYDTSEIIKNIKELIKIDSTMCYIEEDVMYIILNIIKDYNHDGTYDYINIGIKYIENKKNNFIYATNFVDNIYNSIFANKNVIILDKITLLNILKKIVIILSGGDYFYLRPSMIDRYHINIKEILKIKIDEILEEL
jgi:hypothetical protein